MLEVQKFIWCYDDHYPKSMILLGVGGLVSQVWVNCPKFYRFLGGGVLPLHINLKCLPLYIL